LQARDELRISPRKRLFANKILQGAPMSGPGLEADMRPLVDCLPALIEEGPARLIHFP